MQALRAAREAVLRDEAVYGAHWRAVLGCHWPVLEARLRSHYGDAVVLRTEALRRVAESCAGQAANAIPIQNALLRVQALQSAEDIPQLRVDLDDLAPSWLASPAGLRTALADLLVRLEDVNARLRTAGARPSELITTPRPAAPVPPPQTHGVMAHDVFDRSADA
jgi:hypothetical protein